MKAPAFEYVKPRSLTQVFALLSEYGEDAQLLAGGQTLLATLNMRLSEPSLLIDICAVPELSGIRISRDQLHIGALATHSEIEHSALVAQYAPLLAQAAPHIAHRAIRNRGTWGGAIAYADPAAEWPACALALDATVLVRSANEERRIAAADFFLDIYTTALRAGEIVVGCEVPLLRPQQRCHFDELARRHGDYAIVGLAATADLQDGILQHTRLAFLGIASTPLRLTATERFLVGRQIDPTSIEQAMTILADELQGARAPLGDLTNSSNTKRHLAGVLLQRSLRTLHSATSC